MAAAAPATTAGPTYYADYAKPDAATGVSAQAVGQDQCAKPADQRTGAWMCLGTGSTPSVTEGAATTQQSVTAAAAGFCNIAVRWFRTGPAEAQAEGCGPYGYGKETLGTASFTTVWKINGGTIVSNPTYMTSTRNMKDVLIEGDRLYLSDKHPEGAQVDGGSKRGYYGPHRVSAGDQYKWVPKGYSSFENTVKVTSQVNEFIWHDDQYPGRWFVYFKSIVADKSGATYKFRANEALPTDASKGGYDPAP
jgi:hypothetical protein